MFNNDKKITKTGKLLENYKTSTGKLLENLPVLISILLGHRVYKHYSV